MLSHIPSAILEEELLKRQNEETKPQYIEHALERTNQFIKEKGFDKYDYKEVTINAHTLCILLEAIYGDKIGVEHHLTIDDSYTDKRPVISLLDNAIHQTELKLSQLL